MRALANATRPMKPARAREPRDLETDLFQNGGQERVLLEAVAAPMPADDLAREKTERSGIHDRLSRLGAQVAWLADGSMVVPGSAGSGSFTQVLR